MRFSDAAGGSGIDSDVFRVERFAVTLENRRQPVPVSASDQLFGQRSHSFLGRYVTRVLQSLGERAGKPTHFVTTFVTFFDAHGNTHKLVRAAELTVRFFDVHYVGDHSTTRARD